MMEDLGSGFHLAMHDLEIRGAGEVLGEKQSGDMLEVGFSLYNDMLAGAVASLKAGKEPDMSQPLGVVSEINLHLPALLPEDYCPDVHERLMLYKRLASCRTADELTQHAGRTGRPLRRTARTARALLAVHHLRMSDPRLRHRPTRCVRRRHERAIRRPTRPSIRLKLSS